MSHKAYAQAARASAAPRDAEYRAFSEATRRLMAAADRDPRDLKLLIEAVHLNRSLWGVLAADCARETNGLPAKTRAQIIGLARWVSDYSSEAVRRRQSLQPLIDVNRIIMDGLGGRKAGA
jgi:flagellar protein FlaF